MTTRSLLRDRLLALSFLVVVGIVLICDGFDHHVPKGYIYFAMAFSASVEMLNLRLRKRLIADVNNHPVTGTEAAT